MRAAYVRRFSREEHSHPLYVDKASPPALCTRRASQGEPPRVRQVFGRVIEGMEVVRQVELLGSASGSPSALAYIERCGELPALPPSLHDTHYVCMTYLTGRGVPL